MSFLTSIAFWYWAVHILAPANTVAVLAKGRPMGNNSDLYPRWLGTRELLLHRRDPYSPQVTREIQIGFYGRPLDPNNPSDPTATESFVYPLYVAFLLAPAVMVPFHTAVVVLRWLIVASIGVSAPLWMYAVGFRPKWPITVSAMLLATSSSACAAEYFQQNLAALALFFVACAAAATVRNWQLLGGFLLALATVKPDTTGLLILWFLLWAAAQWGQRRRLIWGFTGTMSALLIASWAISPHWVGQFLAAVREYPNYGTDPSMMQVMLQSRLSWPVEAALIISLVIVCWRWKRRAAGSEPFGWALAWVATVTLVVIPKLAPYNELLLIPALVVLVARYSSIKALGIVPRASAYAAAAYQSWQWAAAMVVTVCSLLVSPARLQAITHLPDYASLALAPVTLVAVISTSLAAEKKSYSTKP